EDHPFVLVNPRPTVFVDDLGDSSVRLNVRVWAPSQVWYTVQMELLWKMKVGLEKAGITIPFPQRVIHIAGRVGE
ncbi:MAG: mechanosensitive ion channel, partial [Theionarchaea archaeon]|nr:mechanosensitive ion channel [Theionarchaea archaeon]